MCVKILDTSIILWYGDPYNELEVWGELMKPFWDNIFFDLYEGDIEKETLAGVYGDRICSDFRKIEDAIRNYDLKKALELIDEFKKDY